MAKPLITADRLRELLDYDAENGHFTWKIAAGRRVHAGDVAGWKTDKGYVAVMVDGKTYVAHRLAWFYMYGEWPKEQIDHINGGRDDNRIANLRDVPGMVNSQNRREAKPGTKSGFLGVSKVGSKTSPYQACIRANGKPVYLGVFADPAEAYSVYLAAKRQMHSGCTI